MARTALDDVLDSLKGKIYRHKHYDTANFFTGCLFGFKLDLEFYNLTTARTWELKEHSDLAVFYLIYPQDLTPDEAYNLAHFEREHGLEQAASAQTQPSCTKVVGELPPPYMNGISRNQEFFELFTGI